MFKGVIFDLDGTLLNTIEDLANACNYALIESGLEPYEVYRYKRFVGDGRLKLIERIIPKEKYNERLFNKVLKLYDYYYLNHMVDMTNPYDGVIELLDKLKEKEIKLGILSNKPHEFTTEIVKKYFGDKLDLVYGHRVGYSTKPNPESLLGVINELNLDKSQCIYVGDSNVDMITAKNAGVVSVGVSWGFRGRCELEESGATYIVDSSEELYSILTS